VVRQARLFCGIDEAAAAFSVGLVVEEGDAAPTGDEQVRPTIAVVVADGRAVRVEEDAVEADVLGDVLELEASQVLVELAGVPLDFLLVWTVVETAAGEENVKQAIAIEVDDGGAAAQRFEDGQMAADLAVVVGVDDAGLLCGV